MIRPTLGVLFGPYGVAALLEEVDVPVDGLLRDLQLFCQVRLRKLARTDQVDQPVVTARDCHGPLVTHRFISTSAIPNRCERLVNVGCDCVVTPYVPFGCVYDRAYTCTSAAKAANQVKFYITLECTTNRATESYSAQMVWRFNPTASVRSSPKIGHGSPSIRSSSAA